MCVYSSFGAMEKVSKPVAAVASVAIGPYCFQRLMSHLWVLSPPAPCPIPFPVKTFTSVCVVQHGHNHPKCGSSLVMCTLVLNAPHFYWCGMCRSVLLPVQWCMGKVVY